MKKFIGVLLSMILVMGVVDSYALANSYVEIDITNWDYSGESLFNNRIEVESDVEFTSEVDDIIQQEGDTSKDEENNSSDEYTYENGVSQEITYPTDENRESSQTEETISSDLELKERSKIWVVVTEIVFLFASLVASSIMGKKKIGHFKNRRFTIAVQIVLTVGMVTICILGMRCI